MNVKVIEAEGWRAEVAPNLGGKYQTYEPYNGTWDAYKNNPSKDFDFTNRIIIKFINKEFYL